MQQPFIIYIDIVSRRHKDATGLEQISNTNGDAKGKCISMQNTVITVLLLQWLALSASLIV